MTLSGNNRDQKLHPPLERLSDSTLEDLMAIAANLSSPVRAVFADGARIERSCNATCRLFAQQRACGVAFFRVCERR